LRGAALVTILMVAAAAADPSTQSVTIRTTTGLLQVQAPGFSFIEGAVSDRLREGRSVRVEVDLAVLERPRGAVVAQSRQSYALSFDLWEERFAVTRVGTPARAIWHRTAKNAEAWCLEHLSIPLTALGRLGRETPFWIRLEYRAPDDPSATDAASDEGLTLTALIDRLSRRREQGQPGRVLEAGPFRLSS
jgi:hypothetical protein